MTRPPYTVPALSRSSSFSIRSSARSPTPAAVPGCGRRGTWMRIFGGSPFSTSSHSVGVAINSPSLSRPVMSAITVAGRAASSLIFLPRFSIVPWSASSRRMRLSSTRSAFFRPNSRAISRVPTFPGCARMKATRASRSGKTLSRCFATLSACLAGALLGGGFGCRFRRRGFGRRRYRRAGLAGGGAVRFRLGRRFFCHCLLGRLVGGLAGRLVGRLWRLCIRFNFGRLLPFGRLGGFCFLGAALRLAAALGDAFVDQRDGFLERDGFLRLVAGDRGVGG